MIYSEFVHAATLLFFVFSPLSGLPIFIALTRKMSRHEKVASANKAVAVAGILFIIFAVIGRQLLDVFGISFAGFRVAGGLVLLLLAIEMVFGIKMADTSKKNVCWVILATPILTGPGVITTSILLASKYGFTTTILGGLSALLIILVILRNAAGIMDSVGSNVVEISSKIMGLLIAAMAVEFIMHGGIEFLQAGGFAALGVSA